MFLKITQIQLDKFDITEGTLASCRWPLLNLISFDRKFNSASNPSD